jgi:hypothetical protein
MKSWDKPKSEEMLAKFCNILRNGDVSDESMIQLEIGLKQLENHLKALQAVEIVESEATQFKSNEDPSIVMALEFEYYQKLKKFI